MNFGTKVAQGMGTMPEFEYMHSAETACDTTLDDENVTCVTLYDDTQDICFSGSAL